MDDIVTDPALIESLNAAKARQEGGATSPSMGAVTDPDLIAHLNAAKLKQAGTEPPVSENLRNLGMATVKGIPVVGSQAAVPSAAVASAALQPVLGTGEDRPTFGERVQANVGKYGPQFEQFERRHAGEDWAAQMAGATLSTAGVAKVAPSALGINPTASTLANVGRAGTFGGVVGAGDAYVKGENPYVGAGIGAATMGAGPVVGKGLGFLGKTLSEAISPTNKGVLSGLDQKAIEIATKVARAEGLTDLQIADKINSLGPNGFLGEYGPMYKALTGEVAARSPTGRTAITDALNTRSAGMRDRIENGITNTMGPRINVADLEEQEKISRDAAAKALYDQWRQTSIHPTDELKSLMPRLEAAGAFSEARHKASLEGINWDQNFFTGGDRKNYPTAQSWDYVKRALDDKIAGSKNQFGENTDYTRIYTGLKRDLINAIENSNDPGSQIWKQARQAWGDPTSIMRARQAGMDVWNPSVRRDELIRQLTDYSQPERDAFKQGARDSLAEKMDRSVNGDRVTRDMLRAPANQEKLHYLATNKNVNSQDLIDSLEQEVAQAGNKNEIIGNSSTYPRAAVREMLNPPKGVVASAREKYMPHIMPGQWIPLGSVMEAAEKRRQSSQYERALDALSPILLSQGPQAQAYARALGQGIPVNRTGALASKYGTLLTQGAGLPALNLQSPRPSAGPVATQQ